MKTIRKNHEKKGLVTALLIAASIGMTKEEAVSSVMNHIKNFDVGKYTIKQQKSMFNFAVNNASMGMDLVSDWHKFNDAEKMANIELYTKQLIPSIEKFMAEKMNNSTSSVEKGMLIADTFNNACALLNNENKIDKFQIEKNASEVTEFITKYIYSSTGEHIITTNLLAWDLFIKHIFGQHGAHYSQKAYTLFSHELMNLIKQYENNELECWA